MKQTPDLDRKATELVDHLDAIGRRFMFRRMFRHGHPRLTPREFGLILALGGRGACTMGELAKRLMVAVSSLTGLVDGLAAKGLVIRERLETDRRVVRVALADEGRRRYERIRTKRLRMAREMLSVLDPEEQDLHLALMRKIGRAAQSAEPEE